MKNTLLITTALIITSLMLMLGCSSDNKEAPSKPIDSSTLIYKDGLPYAPGSEVPYSGVAVRYFPDGQKWQEITYKGGKLGKQTGWYQNGQKELEGTYKDGYPDGKWTYWSPDGKKSTALIYKNGKKWDGIFTKWFENGSKQYKDTYKNGKRFEFTEWDEEGNVIDE